MVGDNPQREIVIGQGQDLAPRRKELLGVVIARAVRAQGHDIQEAIALAAGQIEAASQGLARDRAAHVGRGAPGGEVAVLVMVEAIARLVPGVLGNEQSFADDSFAAGDMANLLEGPVFTRPSVWRELEVPEVLTSGDHAKIAAWKHEQAKLRTTQNRPDLLN